MDLTDMKILEILMTNSRYNASFIGERINMSVSAVIERIKKLESLGIIKRYTLLLDAKKTGQNVAAYLSVRIDHPKHNSIFIENIKKMKNVLECHNITGDFDFILKIVVASTEEYDHILNTIKDMPEVDFTRTQVILSTYKHETAVLPEPSQFK